MNEKKRITPELLKRYYSDGCTQEEKRLVEQWIELEDEEDSMNEISASAHDMIQKGAWEKIQQKVQLNQIVDEGSKVIPLYKKLTRYAAAACLAMAIFAAGRYSSNSQSKDPLTATQRLDKKGYLTVFGGNGAQGKIQGETFDISLNGELKLFNSSAYTMSVHCGERVYEIEPKRTYYLSGNEERSSLISSENLANSQFQDFRLEGYFLVRNVKS
ncbi:MAG: hypothetical protein AAGC64_12685 [Bacteroidota bacterium]